MTTPEARRHDGIRARHAQLSRDIGVTDPIDPALPLQDDPLGQVKPDRLLHGLGFLLCAAGALLVGLSGVLWFMSGQWPNWSPAALGMIAPVTPIWGINQALRALYGAPIGGTLWVVGIALVLLND